MHTKIGLFIQTLTSILQFKIYLKLQPQIYHTQKSLLLLVLIKKFCTNYDIHISLSKYSILNIVFQAISINSALTDVTLAYSSLSSRVTYPQYPPPVQYIKLNYPQIAQVPEAAWIWAGSANTQSCPMNITVQDEIKITCKMQPIILYAAADDKFRAQFLGYVLSGEGLSAKFVSVDPKNHVCNQTYKFNIAAQNKFIAYNQHCQYGNNAAVIYGVIQKSPNICCSTNQTYYDSNTCQCHACSALFVGCLTCDINRCFSCNIATGFTLQSDHCVCNSDTYVVNNSLCVKCQKFIDNCTRCSTQSICKQCKSDSVLNSSFKCELCPLKCQSCAYNFVTIGTSSVQFLDCQVCFLGYKITITTNGIRCLEVCGDGLLISHTEQCDDGNSFSGDGCSDKCKIQGGFICTSVQKQTSKCSVNINFLMFVKWVKKEYYRNEISISIGIRPNISQLHNLDFSKAIIFNHSLKQISYAYDHNGTIQLIYSFNQFLQGQNILLIFDPYSASSTFLPLKHNLTIQMITNSNIPIRNYNPNQYLLAEKMGVILMGFLVITKILIILGLFYNRFIGTEVIAVWQISFFSLGTVQKVEPFLTFMFSLGMVNGYNWIGNRDNRHIPQRINAIKYSNNIYENLNCMLLLIGIGAIFLSFVAYFLSLILVKYRLVLRKIFVLLGKQYFMMLTLYQVLNIGYSAGIQILYGQINLLNNFILASIIFVLALLLITSSCLTTNQFQSKSNNFLNSLKSPFQAQSYFQITILYRFFLGFILSLFNESIYVLLLSVFISIFFLIYLLSAKPFLKAEHNYLSSFCQISLVIILGIRLFYRFLKHRYPSQSTSKILLLVVLQMSVLIISVTLGIGCMINQIIQKYRPTISNLKKKATPSCPPSENEIRQISRSQFIQTMNFDDQAKANINN